MGKLVVPMVFVYAPTMLIVLPEHFTIVSFLQVSITCAAGVYLLAVAITGFMHQTINAVHRLAFAVAGILLVAPGTQSDLAGLVLAAVLIAGTRMMASRARA